MNCKQLLALSTTALILAGCESGDINLSPTTNNADGGNGSGNGNGSGSSNPCASYEQSGQTFQGEVNSDGNCFYDSLFVSDTRPITVDSVTFESLEGDAAHVFEDSLYIGEDVNASAAASGQRIPQDGEGTRLVIEEGATMVFTASDSYVRIARGSRIFAEGTASDPITFTADEDAVLNQATESDRGLWGGIQINGNGWTNKCDDGTPTGTRGGVAPNVSSVDDPAYPGGGFSETANNVHGCHVTSEGRPSTYGGNNNSESSGVLQYVVVKHAGFEVVDGDELNAITLNAVGSGTTISHVQVYTSQDDGFEMFGGAVDMDHIVAVNVGDDSIDYSEGYVGDIQYAVVLHTSGANRCIEGDNTGGGRSDDITPSTKLRISNMTCVTSNVEQNQGTHPSGKGSSEGPLFREGVWFEMYNSIVTSYAADNASHECVELDDSEGPQTIDAVQQDDGSSWASSNIIACGEPLKVGADAANSSFDVQAFHDWLNGDDAVVTGTNRNANNVVIGPAPSDNTNLPAMLLEDFGGTTRAYLTAATLADSTGAQVFDQSGVVADGGQLFDASTLGGIFETPTYLGGAASSDDWLADWTVGLDEDLNP